MRTRLAIKVHQALESLRECDKLFLSDMDLKKEGVLPIDFALQLKNGAIAKKQPTGLNADMCTQTVASRGSKVTFTSASPNKKEKKKDTFLTAVEDPEGRYQSTYPTFRFAPSKALLKQMIIKATESK